MDSVRLLAFAVFYIAALVQGSDIKYSTVTGYFLQDEPSTDATTFDYAANNFGLINRTYASDPCAASSTNLTQWQRFARQVYTLNLQSPSNVNYKVLFMGRHGEGYHNAAQTFYGTPAWNCYYAEIDGNATATWTDAHLDAAGIAQALVANAFWAHSLAVQKIPAPQRYYTSPLWRCLQTAHYTFAGLALPRAHPFAPTIKHGLREGISIHTCDRRSTRADIARAFPGYRFEAGFPARDEVWNGVTAETAAAQGVRSAAVLDEIFAGDEESTWVSITSHSGEIASLLSVLGHQPFSLNTGAVIPVLVRAETVEGTETTSAPPWTVSPHCTSPPVTSVGNGGPCVCQGGKAPVTTTLAGSAPTDRVRV